MRIRPLLVLIGASAALSACTTSSPRPIPVAATPAQTGVEGSWSDPNGIISTFQGGDDILRAMQAGAKTYLPKSVQREELIKAVRAIARGETYLPNVVAGRLAERLRRPDLTSRELEVLRLVAAGNSNKDIAGTLSIEVGTVKLHVGKILEKLHARDRTEAATMAIQAGIVWLD